jgi:hypothetical protein
MQINAVLTAINMKNTVFLEVTSLGLEDYTADSGDSAADICASNLTVITYRSRNIMTILRIRKIATLSTSMHAFFPYT